jgi:hypothetical protein
MIRSGFDCIKRREFITLVSGAAAAFAACGAGAAASDAGVKLDALAVLSNSAAHRQRLSCSVCPSPSLL